MIGLGFDIVGALLVAVEAIKIENFRALRDLVLKKAHSYTLSPRIVFVDEDGVRRIQNPRESRPSESFPGVFMALHYVAGFVVLLLLNGLLDGLIYIHYILERRRLVLGLEVVLAVPVLLFAATFGVFFVFWGLDEVVHMTLSFALTRTMKTIDFIEAKTPTGTVGILGFLLLAVGFLFQFVGTYLTL